MRDHEQTFLTINPTGDVATSTRQKLNKKYSKDKAPFRDYPHEWHGSLNGVRDEKILCAGIDTAMYASNLRDRLGPGGEVVCVDVNSVRFRKNITRFKGDDRFTLHNCLLWKLAFPSSSFDIVLCTYTLHRIGHPIKGSPNNVLLTLKELSRVLRGDGFCLVATHAESSFPELLDLYRRVCAELGLWEQNSAEFDHFRGFPQETAEGELRNFFNDVTFDEVDTSLSFPTLESYIEYWDCFPFPAFDKVTDGDRKRVRDRVLALAAEQLAIEGSLEITKPSGVFICRAPSQPSK